MKRAPRRYVAAMELGRRTLTHAPRARLQISSEPQDAVDLSDAAAMSQTAGGAVRHRCCSIPGTACCGRSCSRSARLKAASCVSRATSSAKPRLAARRHIVVFHNHPSGDPIAESRGHGVDPPAGGGRCADGD